MANKHLSILFFNNLSKGFQDDQFLNCYDILLTCLN